MWRASGYLATFIAFLLSLLILSTSIGEQDLQVILDTGSSDLVSHTSLLRYELSNR